MIEKLERETGIRTRDVQLGKLALRRMQFNIGAGIDVYGPSTKRSEQ